MIQYNKARQGKARQKARQGKAKARQAKVVKQNAEGTSEGERRVHVLTLK